MKKTPWFSNDVLPVRIGVYEIEYWSNRAEYQFWDGSGWIFGNSSVDSTAMKAVNAPELGAYIYRTSPHRWRGLTK
jgi:hypothetical protein